MDQIKEECSDKIALYSEKLRLFKKYLPKKILLKSSKYELLLNFKVLSRFSRLVFFNVIFPQEVINFINNIYIELIRKDIDIHTDHDILGHICPCDSNIDCHKTWYNMTNDIVFPEKKEENDEYTKFNTYPSPMTANWVLNHCNVVQKKGGICHNIFFFFEEDEEYKDNGFCCDCCGRNCCIECLGKIDTKLELFTNIYYCIECRK